MDLDGLLSELNSKTRVLHGLERARLESRTQTLRVSMAVDCWCPPSWPCVGTLATTGSALSTHSCGSDPELYGSPPALPVSEALMRESVLVPVD